MTLRERARGMSRKDTGESWEELFRREQEEFERLVALEAAGRLSPEEARHLAHLRHVRPDLERFRRGEIPEPLREPIRPTPSEREQGAGVRVRDRTLRDSRDLLR